MRSHSLRLFRRSKVARGDDETRKGSPPSINRPKRRALKGKLNVKVIRHANRDRFYRGMRCVFSFLFTSVISARFRSQSRSLYIFLTNENKVLWVSFYVIFFLIYRVFILLKLEANYDSYSWGQKNAGNDVRRQFAHIFRGFSEKFLLAVNRKTSRLEFRGTSGGGNNEVPCGSARIAMLISFVKRFINARSFRFIG